MLTVPPPQVAVRITSPIVSALCAAAFLVAVAIGHRQDGDRSRLRKCVAAGIVSLVGGLAALPLARASFANPLAQHVILDDEEEAILASLLHNTYRPFDRLEENLVYDRLAMSISGDLLEEVHLQMRSSMELEGARPGTR